MYFDDLDRHVWASFKSADDNTSVVIMTHLDELTRVASDPVVFWNSLDEVFEIYFGQAGIDLYRARQEEGDFNAFGGDDHQEQEFVDDYDDDDVSPQENQAMLLESTRLAIEDEGFQLVDSDATVHIVPDHAVNAMVAPAPLPAFVVPPVNQWIALDDFFLFGTNQQVEVPPGGPAAWVPPVVPHHEPMLGPAVIFDELTRFQKCFQRCSAPINFAPGHMGFGLLRDSSFSLWLHMFFY